MELYTCSTATIFLQGGGEVIARKVSEVPTYEAARDENPIFRGHGANASICQVLKTLLGNKKKLKVEIVSLSEQVSAIYQATLGPLLAEDSIPLRDDNSKHI